MRCVAWRVHCVESMGITTKTEIVDIGGSTPKPYRPGQEVAITPELEALAEALIDNDATATLIHGVEEC